MTWYHPALAQRALDEGDAEIKKSRAEIERLRERLAQIVIVCDDNASVGNTALALKFVREIATTK